MTLLKGVCIGAGYFSQFHYDAWNRIPDVRITALAELDESRARNISEKFAIPRIYKNIETMINAEKPDFIDIITPPSSHLAILSVIAPTGIPVICQKPLAPDFDTALAMQNLVKKHDLRFMVHENFRFQPWHREIKSLLKQDVIGVIFNLNMRSRQGDGWGEDAYLGRQPYFRDMPRLLVHETGIHFIDVFQYLAGPVQRVYAMLQRLNPVIKGEDSGLLIFEFRKGGTGIWDANRYNESNAENPRYTFGEMLLEGEKGSIRLYADGAITTQLLGHPEMPHPYIHENKGFAGDCVHATQQHFIDCLKHDKDFETHIDMYIQNLRVQEACYRSSEQRLPIDLESGF